METVKTEALGAGVDVLAGLEAGLAAAEDGRKNLWKPRCRSAIALLEGGHRL